MVGKASSTFCTFFVPVNLQLLLQTTIVEYYIIFEVLTFYTGARYCQSHWPVKKARGRLIHVPRVEGDPLQKMSGE